MKKIMADEKTVREQAIERLSVIVKNSNTYDYCERRPSCKRLGELWKIKNVFENY